MAVESSSYYSGVCVGGPCDGQQLVSRYPKGILLVDKPADRCWVADWDGSKFIVREPEGRELVTDWEDIDRTRDNRVRAALEPDFDVLAVSNGV